MSKQHSPRPWYREPYVWLIVTFPMVAILAGTVTIYLAIKSDDGLVKDDYYKEGLQINMVLKRDRAAVEYGMAAVLLFNHEAGMVRVKLESKKPYEYPEQVNFKLLHTTRSGYDQILKLDKVGPQFYQGKIQGLPAGTWNVQVETQEWRLVGIMKDITTTLRLET